LCEKLRSITQSQGGEEYPTYNKKIEANFIGHIFHMNCLLKRIIEGKMEGGIEMSGRQGRRLTQLVDILKEKSYCWEFKERACDCCVWRTRCRRGCGLP
jgi:hypothetical protein